MHYELKNYLTSNYLQAADKLRGQKQKRRIVAYVESYDDVFFWRNLFSDIEPDDTYFDVMLPSRNKLQKGKKSALLTALSNGLGPNMIACVDADYDYLLEGCSPMSQLLLSNQYIFHTYAYAIENFQCYAPSLHNVCVMATLNDDHTVFDFKNFMATYSRTIWPLFVWSVWAYRNGHYRQFSLTDFAHIVSLKDVNLHDTAPALQLLEAKVSHQVKLLESQFPDTTDSRNALTHRLLQLGLTPDTTYLYMRGHDLFETVAAPLVEHVCTILRRRREREIHELAVHSKQKQNELAGYLHSSAAPLQMLKKQTDYEKCSLFKRIQQDIQATLFTQPANT